MEDKAVLVTGGGSGIGLATAQAFAAAGARVVVADVDAERAQSAVAELGERGLAVRADMSVARQVEALVAAALERFGAIDCFHNNAGIGGEPAELHELTEAQWARVMDVNLRGAWLGLKHVLPHMRARRRGAVVNTASVAGRSGSARLAPYCASKAGVLALTQVAAIENAHLGIRVNAVAPGLVATPLLAGADGESGGPFPAGRLGAPEEVAAAVVWLCSDAASFVNGTALTVDGGWTSTLGPRRPRAS
jgi:NAD(P)-dependent dehydrogenase (short-subunit alcohol dehydrogenase family)